jgi:hypothetical protein
LHTPSVDGHRANFEALAIFLLERIQFWSATKIVQSFASTSPTSGGADIQPVEGGSDRKVSFDRTNPISLAGSGRVDSVRASSSSTKTAEAWAFGFGNPAARDQRSLSDPSGSDELVGALLRERPGQHEFGVEHCASRINQAVQRRRHPFMYGVRDPPLDVLDGAAGIALVPTPVEVLGDGAQLDDPFRKLSLARLADPYALTFRTE